MTSAFVTYSIRDALRRELSWTHYRQVLRVDHVDARALYCAIQNDAVQPKSACGAEECDMRGTIDCPDVAVSGVFSPHLTFIPK